MSRFIGLVFSSTDPRNYPSLVPTFITFMDATTGASIARPPIAQILTPGITTTGVYGFTYTASVPTYFMVDGITVSPSTDRLVFGIIDPFHQVDNQLTAVSTTLTAMNSTLVALGTTGIAYGVTSVALGNSNFAINTSLFAASSSLLAIGITNGAIGLTTAAIGLTVSALVTNLDVKVGSTLSSFGSTSVDPGDLFGFLKRAQEFREGDQTFDKTSGAWNISTRGNTLLISKTLQNSSTTVTKS